MSWHAFAERPPLLQPTRILASFEITASSTELKSGFGDIPRFGSKCRRGMLIAPFGWPASNSGTDLTSRYMHSASDCIRSQASCGLRSFIAYLSSYAYGFVFLFEGHDYITTLLA